jgi:hypothetical protein
VSVVELGSVVDAEVDAEGSRGSVVDAEVDAEGSRDDVVECTNNACLFNCLLYLVILMLCFFAVDVGLDARSLGVRYNDGT